MRFRQYVMHRRSYCLHGATPIKGWTGWCAVATLPPGYRDNEILFGRIADYVNRTKMAASRQVVDGMIAEVMLDTLAGH